MYYHILSACLVAFEAYKDNWLCYYIRRSLSISEPNFSSGLKLLIRLSSDLGLKEATEYAQELKKVERVQEQRESRAASGSRPGSRR